MEQLLIKLGLSDKEAKVYLALLELSKETVQNIAHKAKINRATTYVILEKLMKLGLASQLEEGKKTHFIAENPRELVNILESEKREIEERHRELEETMTQLQAIYNAKQDKPIVRFFEGADGLEALDRYGYDQYPRKSEILQISPIGLIEKLFSQRRKKSLNERIGRGIRSKIIYTRDVPFTEEENRSQLREAYYLKESKDYISGTVTIFPNWGVKLYHFDQNNPHGVLVQSPGIADTLKKLFEYALEGVRRQEKKSS